MKQRFVSLLSAALATAVFGVTASHGFILDEKWNTTVGPIGTDVGTGQTDSFTVPEYPGWTYQHLWGGDGFNSSFEVLDDNRVFMRGWDPNVETANDNWSEQRFTTGISVPPGVDPLIVTGNVGGINLGAPAGNWRVGLYIGGTIFAFHPGFNPGGAQGLFIIRDADTDANYLPFAGFQMGFVPATDGTQYEIGVHINPDDTFVLHLQGAEFYTHTTPIAGLYGGDVGLYRAYDNRGIGVFGDISVIPEPATVAMWMALAALVGVIGLRRFRRRA